MTCRTTTRGARWLTVLSTLAALVAIPAGASGQSRKGAAERPTSRLVTLDFRRAPIEDVVQHFSELTQRNFILSGELAGKTITVLGPTPVSVDEAYQVFLTALAGHGMTIVRTGKFYKIVKAKGALNDVRGTRGASVPASGGRRMQLVEIVYADAEALRSVISQLSGPSGEVIADARTNSLILIDEPRSLARLTSLIVRLDVAQGPDDLHVVPIEHRSAEDLSNTLNALQR